MHGVIGNVGIGETMRGMLPWPKAMTAGGATRQKAAKTAIAIATRNPSPIRSAFSMGQA